MNLYSNEVADKSVSANKTCLTVDKCNGGINEKQWKGNVKRLVPAEEWKYSHWESLLTLLTLLTEVERKVADAETSGEAPAGAPLLLETVQGPEVEVCLVALEGQSRPEG